MFKDLFKQVIIEYLAIEAKIVLKRKKPKIVAVTGSVGKTSAKDAIYSALPNKEFIRKNKKSYNADFGVPLTVLDLPNAWNNPFRWIWNVALGAMVALFPGKYPKLLILEVGAEQPGGIPETLKIFTPDVVVLTRYPEIPVHVEFFDSPEEVIAEKQELVKALKPKGVLILNKDDDLIMRENKNHADTVTYGFAEDAEIRASDYELTYQNDHLQGIQFKVRSGSEFITLRFDGLAGKQHVYPVLAALSVGKSQEVSLEDMWRELKGHTTTPGRMHLLEGKNRSTLIDDSYNASPVAVLEALSVLKDARTAGRKIAALADMAELGQFSKEEHEHVGREVAPIVDLLVLVGEKSKTTEESSLASGLSEDKIKWFTSSQEAATFLSEEIRENDLILVKGSQSQRMEHVSKALLAHPDQAPQLLVRQEKEWETR